MSEEIKLKRVDLRLKPDAFRNTDEVLNDPGKVIDYADNLLKNMKVGQIAIFNLTAKGNVLRVIITTRKTIWNLGPGMAAVLRESLLTNCLGIIALEKAVKPVFDEEDRAFTETLIYSFKEMSMEIIDYIKTAYGNMAYTNLKSMETDGDKYYFNGRVHVSPFIKNGFHRKYKQPESLVELTEEGGLVFDNDITDVCDAVDAVIRDMKYKNREHVYIIPLDEKRQPLSYSVVYVGAINCSVANAGDIMRNLVLQKADSFVMLHNHPSSVSEPSNQDDEITARIVNASKLVGIEMLDHLIVGGITGDYYSYAEERGDEYRFRKWSDIAKETKDEKLIKWFSACRYVSVKLGLLLNPAVDRAVVERLAVDDNEAVSRHAKERMKKLSEAAEGIKSQIEIIRLDNKVAENGRIYSYGKVLKK